MENITSTLKTNVEKTDLEVFDNTREIAVKINESKARLIYNKYCKATNGETVLSLFGTFLACLTTLLTSTFHDVWNIEGSAYILNAIFILLTVIFFVLSSVWLIKWIHSLVKLNESAFINELKGDN